MTHILLIAAVLVSVLVVAAVSVLAAFGQMNHYQSYTD